jgi:hypothetical protein
LPPVFVRALGLIKYAAARANHELGRLDARLAKAIETVAMEVADGKYHDHFVVDVFETGSGTSANMNANEVIANLAAMALGAKPGSRAVVHPNDHVNLGQSSNDVFPSAIHVALMLSLTGAAAGAREPRVVPAGEGAGVRRDPQERPHAPSGCLAADAGPGVQRLRAPARQLPATDRELLPAPL